MSEVFLLGNGVVVTSLSAGNAKLSVISDGAVAWQGERILAVGPEAELRRAHPTAPFLNAHGGLILPGLINLHHHFYAALARGLDPGVPLTSFADILDGLWWRLDRALDLETVRLSAQLSVADCIRWGCTTVFDHHASPSCLAGSLDILAAVLDAHGLPGVLCYEVTDRNGRDEARAGIEENLRFIGERSAHPRIRGTLGLHASFTLRNETLAEVAVRRPAAAGCHIHVAEDPVDVTASRRAFGSGPVERLENFGLLDERCLLAHGIHLEHDDYARIAEHRAVLIHNPESNANNGVGHLDVARTTAQGCLVGLGTDGMSSAMLRALRFAFLAHRAARGSTDSSGEAVTELLSNNAKVARRFFDEPLLGELVAGAPADMIAVDTPPPTPVSAENFFGHLVYGASEAPVRHTIARGRVLLEDFRHTTFDLAELAARAREQTPALWRRFRASRRGTEFLGE